MAFRSDELKIPSGKKNKAEKGQEPADPSQLEVQDAGTGGENLPITSEEERAIEDMISEGSPVVESKNGGERPPTLPNRRTL